MEMRKITQNIFGAVLTALLIALPMCAKATPMLHEGVANSNEGEQLWWGYFNESEAASLYYNGYLGYGSATTLDAAICIPAGHPIAGGATIKSVRFWLGDDISGISSDLTVWIASSLPSTVSSATYKQVVPKTSLKARLNEVELTTPYSVNNGECYIGYSFSISKKCYPVMCGGADAENALFYRWSGRSWENYSGSGYGKLAFQVLLDGVVLNDYDVKPTDFGTSYVLKGSQVDVPVKIANGGKETVTSIAYTITTNGSTTDEKTCTVGNLAFNNTTTLSIPFAADSDSKKYDKTLTITKVNGKANESAKNTATGMLITITEKPTPVPVVEEFTGTWCGWCTVGYDGMEKTNETFGDKVVLIAAHNSDPMEIADYSPIMNRVSGFPSSFINRTIDAYPSAGNLKYYLQNSLNDVTVGDIKAKATWADANQTKIKVDTDTRFVYSDDNGQYGIAYVLVEDGLTGTGSSWAQANYLSGNSNYAQDYPFWYSAGSKVTGIVFNHVAVGAWNIENGMNGSVSPAFAAGETQQYSTELNIASKSVIQDKTKLKVAVLLIDRSTGGIVNASETTIGEGEPTAVESIGAKAVRELERYTLDGRKIGGPQTGVNIVKMSDGSIRKVLVK